DSGNARPAIHETMTDILTIPRAAMVEVGSAAWTLGAMYRLCGGRTKSTYARLEHIREMACIPARNGVRSVQRHLRKLEQYGWLQCLGRDNRRTNTWALTKKAIEQQQPFASCARWAIKMMVNLGLDYSAIAFFAVAVSENALATSLAGQGYE